MFIYNPHLFDRINEMWHFKPYRKPMIAQFKCLEKQLGRLLVGCGYDCDEFYDLLYANCMLRLSHIVMHGPCSSGTSKTTSGSSKYDETKNGSSARLAIDDLDFSHECI